MTDAPTDPVVVSKPLPFSDKKQAALVGHLLTNPQLFLQTHAKLQPGWFHDVHDAKLVTVLKFFYSRRVRHPNSLEEFLGLEDWSVYDMAERNRIFARAQFCRAAALEFGADVIRDELTVWYRSQVFKVHVEKAVALHNAGDDAKDPLVARQKLESAFLMIKKADTEISNASFEPEESVNFDDIADGSYFIKRQHDLEDACTFGCPRLDKLLNKNCHEVEAKNGELFSCALQRGDHTTVLAPTNRGKTTVLLTAIRHNLMLGKSILFVIHEGRSQDLKGRLLSVLLQQDEAGLMAMAETQQGRANLLFATSLLKAQLSFVPMVKPGLTVEEVEGVIRRYQDRRIAETGRGYDMIVDDYPAILTTVQAQKGNLETRAKQEIVYRFFTAIGLEYGAHVLDAIQTNREGSKINNQQRGSEKRLIGMEDVAECWGAMQTATNVIAFNRDTLAEARHRLTFHICKSRSNEVGWSVVTKTNFGVATTHGPQLDTTFYRGNDTLANTIDTLLETYKGNSIPDKFYPLG